MRYMYKITADTIKTASIFSFMEVFFKCSDRPLYGSHKGRTVHQNYTNRICSEILLKS